MAGSVTVNRRLWLTADRESIVEDGDPASAFLWAIEGESIALDEAERVGYAPLPVEAPAEPEVAAEPEPAQVAPDEDKVAAPAEDKVRAPRTPRKPKS